MAETTYTAVTWTVGDVITEAKLDNMTANDRAVDAHYQGSEYTERADPSTPASGKVHLYAKDKGGVAALYAINDAGTVYELSEGQPCFSFSIAGTAVTGTSLAPQLIVPRTLTITKAYISVKTAPTGADLIADILKNGSSIWASTPANRVKVLAGATSGNETDFDVTALAEGDILTLDIDQIGSTVAGADITVVLKCK